MSEESVAPIGTAGAAALAEARFSVDSAPPSRRSFLQGSVAAAAGLCFGLEACSPSGSSINFYNWDTYIGATTLADFRRTTGISVNMSLFSNNDELFAKFRNGNGGYDVIVPTNDFVQRFVLSGLIDELNHRLIPNAANIAPAFRSPPFDPGRRYSMPYTWLVIGIGYRKSKVEGVPDSWKWLFDSDRYKGRIGLVSEASDLCRLALRYLGCDMNTRDPAALAKVEELLTRQKENVAVFHDDNGQDLLLSGDVDIVMEFNGDIAQVMREDDDLDFVVPREGSQLYSDCLCIPRNAPHPALGQRFINFLLDARVGAGIADTIRYPTPNAAAAALMPAEYRLNRVIFPPADAMRRCEYSRYNGEDMARIYEEIITKVRAA